MGTLFRFVRGVAVGALGTWVAGRVRSQLEQRSGREARELEERAAIAEREQSYERRLRFGRIALWGLGIAGGLAYAFSGRKRAGGRPDVSAEEELLEEHAQGLAEGLDGPMEPEERRDDAAVNRSPEFVEAAPLKREEEPV